MSNSLSTREHNNLYNAFLTLKNREEVAAFLRDLCTLSEIEAMKERFQDALLIDKGVPYRDVSKKTGSSTATVTRVAHWLHYGEGGYRLVLDRLK